MSDPQSYISSGILELYVSGGLSEQEIEEVRLMSLRYPEIQKEIDAIEAAMAEVAEVFKRKPKRDLLAGVMDMIEQEEQKPIVADIPEEKTEPAVIKEFKQESKQEKEQLKVANPFRWIAVAAAIALLISLVFNFTQYQQIQENQAQIASLTQTNQVFAEQNQRTSEQLKIVSSPLFQEIDLDGQPASPESRARVYYSATLNEIYLHTGNLSISDEKKQFQLWAIIDGVPVDAGVFDPADGLASIKFLQGNIQAFAVTLEPKGGSPSPTMDQMYVLGAVATS